jgi:hypothetical protein
MKKGTLIRTTNRALSMTAPAALILVLAAFPSLAGAEGAPGPKELSGYTERVPTGFVNWGEGYAEVVVQAPYETVRYGSSHAKIRAIEEAENRADEAFFRLLRGINASGDTRLAGNTELEEALKSVSKGQRKMTKQRTANVTLTATFRVPLYGKKGLAGAVYKVAWETPEEGSLAGTSGGDYTSVVLDASSTTLQAALFPHVRNEAGEVLFGPADLDQRTLDRGTPVTYVVRGESQGKKGGLSKTAQKEYGDNPLVIQVDKIAGEFLADIVLRPDNEKMLRDAQVGDLLAQGRVFIIKAASVDVSDS